MSGQTVQVALLSHTNAGKTTLARTLLRQDIGAVMDRAHVTETAEPHVLLRTEEGDEFVLWDTPGFGDSVRLLRRLERSGQPIGWFLSQVWDRFADRPFWCSQQAMRAARDSADVVLYVANATEDPAAAGYVAPELRILEWLGKPTLLLLNQLGTRIDAAREAEVARRWQQLLDDTGAAAAGARVLPFDAFARCWLQEHALLEAIAPCLPEERQAPFARIRAAWHARDAAILQQSAAVIARQLARVAADVEHAEEASLRDKARSLLQGTAANAAEAAAQRALLQRLDAAVREGTAELVALHGLTGGASEDILANLERQFATDRSPDADRAGIFGGLVSGALGGLAADLAVGGLTFGAGALLGGIAGAFGARRLTQLYNAERGVSGSTVRWSDEFLLARIEAALVRYLAVAHYGRGRGAFEPGQPDPRWQALASALVGEQSAALRDLLPLLRGGATNDVEPHVHALLWQALVRLYPDAARSFGPASPPD